MMLLKRPLSRSVYATTSARSVAALSTSSHSSSSVPGLRNQFPQIAEKLQLKSENWGVYSGEWSKGGGKLNTQLNPTTGERLGKVFFGTVDDYEDVIRAMNAAKKDWRDVPAPVRGEVVRLIGEKLRENKTELGIMISLEMGKILTEGLGEVQEAIDICDYAVGLSRCLNGSVIPSERPGHFMMERYNPLQGHVGIISAFNFPVAVYFWNLAISLVCGNVNLWKPHENLSMTSVAVTKIVAEVLNKTGHSGAIASMICGEGSTVGHALVQDPRTELVSFTGSTERGRDVSSLVASRFGKSILELGGNNAMIVDKSANLDMAVRATLFGAVGTCGQRCTTQRRLYLHESIYDDFMNKLIPAYESVKIGSPLDPSTLCGPLHSQAAVKMFTDKLEEAQDNTNKGKILTGGRVLVPSDFTKNGNFVSPAIVAVAPEAPVTKSECFVPILYVMKVASVDEAVKYNNAVAHGLSSALFTQDLGQVFQWTGPQVMELKLPCCDFILLCLFHR
mmetsp:Transcript_14666/g.24424  ORF Transcript_14666/g.24424 Transcript_14666/m.24424 type:complete len:506 (+) Transcript_14666:29-1546(+)